MDYGLTSLGFIPKTFDVIVEEYTAKYKLVFGEQINLLPSSVFSQLINIPSEREALLWEQMEAIYFSQYPTTAQGINLDYAVGISGNIQRKPATYSYSMEQIFRSSVPNIVIPADTRIVNSSNENIIYTTIEDKITGFDGSVDGSGHEIQVIEFFPAPASGTWAIDYGGNVSAGLAWDESATALQSTLRTLTGNSSLTVSGDQIVGYTVTFVSPNTPDLGTYFKLDTSTLLDAGSKVVSGQIIYKQFGGYVAKVAARALNYGKTYYANARTLTTMQSPIANIMETYNVLQATTAQDQESDAELKIRRNNELAQGGSSSVDAIRADILTLNNVQECLVAENTSISTHGSRPPKSFEVFVSALGKTDLDPSTGPNTTLISDLRQQIGNIIYANKSAGIESYGTIPVSVIDSMGNIKTVKFSQPNRIPIYVIMTIQVGAVGTYPDNLVELVVQKLIEFGSTLGIGDDVVVYPTMIGLLRDFSGILDIDTKIGTAPSPTLDQTIVIADGSTPPYAVEISDWDATRITVTLTTSPV